MIPYPWVTRPIRGSYCARFSGCAMVPTSSCATQVLVELGELAALSLPAHPHALLRVPETRPVEEEEHVLASKSVPGVQRFDSRHRCREDFFVALSMLRWRVRKIAQDRELQI